MLEIVIPSITTFFAGYFGLCFGIRQIKIHKQLEFYEHQLRDFYSPLLGCRNEIHAKSSLREKKRIAAGVAWKALRNDKKEKVWDSNEAFKPFEKIINYDNEQFESESMPLYERMLLIFRENYWLAELSTKKWYLELCEFVEIWRQALAGAIPLAVIKKLEHTEDKLKPFYEELEAQTNILIGKISEKENIRISFLHKVFNFFSMK